MIDARWFLDSFWAELPTRTHTRDTDEGGYPELHPGFLNYVSDGENGQWAKYRTDSQRLSRCYHQELPCGNCGGTGYRPEVDRRFHRPMKRALKQVSQTWVPKDRPKLDVLLVSFAYHDGNTAFTAHALRPSYSYCWSVQMTERLIEYALREVRRAYRETEIGYRGISEQQATAEAA